SAHPTYLLYFLFSLYEPRHPPISALFPYTTLFRSGNWSVKSSFALDHAWLGLAWHPSLPQFYLAGGGQGNVQEVKFTDGVLSRLDRKSTRPELQSRENLVCRLLLEKKKKT